MNLQKSILAKKYRQNLNGKNVFRRNQVIKCAAIIIHITSNISQCDGQNNQTIYSKTLHEANVL